MPVAWTIPSSCIGLIQRVEAFAVTTPEAPIYRINPMMVKDLTKELFTLQDKRLLGIEGDDIAMLEVKTREDHYTLIRQNNTWVLEDAPQKTLDQEKVALFVAQSSISRQDSYR